jgi:hypothetical protein
MVMGMTWLVGGIGNLEAILINLQRPNFGFEGRPWDAQLGSRA